MRNLFTWAAARLVAAFALALPLAAMAATSTYSTYKDDTDTPSAGGAFSNHQRFQLNASWMFLAEGTDIADSAAAVNVESIAVKWASSTHDSADIGGNSNPQPDAYLVLTTPQDVIVGISAVNDAKWVANGTSTFAFTDVVISPNAQYYFYFATDVSGLAVGAVMPSANKKNGRVLCAWHGSGHGADETVRIGASNQYSINCSFVVSAASASTLTTASEAVNLSTGTDPVVVTGAVADGVVNVASGATVPSLTVVGEATTLKLTDALTATYFYLPATTTIDASVVSFALPSGDATTAETVLVSGKISSASDPVVTLPTLAEGYSFEPLVRDDTGIKAIVSKPVDASVTLDGTEQKWSEVKPEGWINSAVPVINIDNSVAGTLIFDEDVQAAKINITANYPVTFVRGDSVNVDIPYLASPSYNLRAIFTNFVSIPQTAHNTDSGDQITANGTTTLTSFPQIDASAQSAKLIIAQPATFSDRGIYVTGSKVIDINSGATISTTRLVLGNNSSTTQTVTQNGGTITITGTAGAGSTSASVLLGHWNSTSTLKTLGGTFTANNATSRLGWDGTTTWQIGGGESAATVNLYGLVNGQNGHTGSGTLNIMANGTLNLGTGGIQFSNSGNGGNINLAGGTIDTGAAAVTIANAKSGGTILNQNKTTVFNVDANRTLTVDAVVSGEGVGTLDKTGAGKMVLAKTATTKGKLLVSAGTVEFNEGISWGSNGTVEIGQNGALNVLTSEPVEEGGLLVAGAFTVNGTVLSNGTAVDFEVKSDGIYVKANVTITITPVTGATATVTVNGEPREIEDGHITVTVGDMVVVTYTGDEDHKITGSPVEFEASTTTTSVDTSSVTSEEYKAQVMSGTAAGKYTSVTEALSVVYMTYANPAGVVVKVLDPDYEDGGSYNELYIWDESTRTYTFRTFVARVGMKNYDSLAEAMSEVTAGGTVVCLVDAITLDDVLVITNEVTLGGVASGTTITGADLNKFIRLDEGAALKLVSTISVNCQIRFNDVGATVTVPEEDYTEPSMRPITGYSYASTSNGDGTKTYSLVKTLYLYAAGVNVTLAYSPSGETMGAIAVVNEGDVINFTATPAEGYENPVVTANNVTLTPEAGVYSVTIGDTNMTIQATATEVYVEGQDICLDGTNVTINASQAAWLKKCGDKTTVSNALEKLAFEQFSDAYLLNLNILDGNYRDYEKGDFVVTDFHFETENEKEYVVVGVSLERHGALGGINGTLKLMGTSLLGTQFTLKATSDFSFADNDTTTLKCEKDGATLFFKPVIE